MNVIDLFSGIANIVSGIKTAKQGLEGIKDGLGWSFGEQIMPGDGKDPQLKMHKVGNNVDQRVELIKQQAKKGTIDPKLRAFATKILSSKCGKCTKCKTMNVIGPMAPMAGWVQGMLNADDSSYKCGKCGTKNAVGNCTWCVPEKSWKHEPIAIFNTVRAMVRYTRDIQNVDTYQHPLRTLEWGGGDCDDYSSLLAALLGAVGYPVKLHIMETKNLQGKREGDWNHILILVGVPPRAPSQWLPLDGSLNQPAGWYPPKHMIYKTKSYKI